MICYPHSYAMRMFKLRRMRWAKHMARIGEKRNDNKGVVGITWKTKRRCEDCIIMYLKGTECD